MPHPNKAKGDRAERGVLRILSEYDSSARRTRPGRREDEGDIHALSITWQVKDVARPVWRDWLTQIAEQVERSPTSTAPSSGNSEDTVGNQQNGSQ